MKNKLSDLNNHLFVELERINSEDLKDDDIILECKRAQAISKLAKTIVDNASVQIKAVQISQEVGASSSNLLLGFVNEG